MCSTSSPTGWCHCHHNTTSALCRAERRSVGALDGTPLPVGCLGSKKSTILDIRGTRPTATLNDSTTGPGVFSSHHEVAQTRSRPGPAGPRRPPAVLKNFAFYSFSSRKSKRRSALPHIIDHMIPKREQSSFTLKASNTSRQPDCPRFAGLSRHRWTPCKRRILSSDLVLSPAHTPTATSSHAAPSVPHVSSS